MHQIKKFLGKEGVKVSIYREGTTKFYFKTKGKKPEPRVYTTSSGAVYGIERFAAPTGMVESTWIDEVVKELPKAQQKAVAEDMAQYQAQDFLRYLEQSPTPPPPTPPIEVQANNWLEQVLTPSPVVVQPPARSLLAAGIDSMLGK